MKPANYHSHDRREMLEFLPGEFVKVLDIGCGEGRFGNLLKQINNAAHITGVDIDEMAALKAKDSIDRVIVGDIVESLAKLADNSFDLVICNDIIEHLIDPDELLTNLRSKIADNGKLLISIPNFRYFYNLHHIIIKKDFEYSDQGIRDVTHLRFFTRNSIQRLLVKSGYKLERIEGINAIKKGFVSLLKPFLIILGQRDCLYLQFAIVCKK